MDIRNCIHRFDDHFAVNGFVGTHNQSEDPLGKSNSTKEMSECVLADSHIKDYAWVSICTFIRTKLTVCTLRNDIDYGTADFEYSYNILI